MVVMVKQTITLKQNSIIVFVDPVGLVLKWVQERSVWSKKKLNRKPLVSYLVVATFLIAVVI